MLLSGQRDVVALFGRFGHLARRREAREK